MTPKKVDKYQRIKLLSIPVLLCILAYVLQAPTEASVAQSTPAEMPMKPLLPSPTSPPTVTNGVRTNQVWPDVDLDFMSQTSPFAGTLNRRGTSMAASQETASFEAETSDDLAAVAQDLSAQPIDYLFQSKNRKVVMLGGQVFETGEKLTEDLTLQDIQDHALIITRLANPPASPAAGID